MSTSGAGPTWRSSPMPGRRPISDPGMDLAAAWAGEGGRVEAIPGASAVLVAVAVSGDRRAALDLRGVPAAQRARASRAAGPAGRRRARRRHLRGPEPSGGDAARPRRRLRRRAARRRSAASSRSSTSRSFAARSERLSGPQPTGRCRPVARSSIVLGWSSVRGFRVGGRRRCRAGRRGPRARVEVLVAAGRARGDAAREVARDDRCPAAPALPGARSGPGA